ncbi:MAG: IMP dehydrogenase [Aigarchaeota archaeon]|nr:IMP dehydrogenase [Aigarchaeota archaeon]MDW8021464.1 IMP dehydrogenase [Nitrososphaerota archaeon]
MGFFSGKLEAAVEGVSFDDVLLKPRYSSVIPREDLDTSTRITRSVELKIPVASSPMDTVTESEMAIALAELGGIGIIHRNMGIEEQAAQVRRIKERGLLVGAAVGILDDGRFEALVKAEVDVVVIDVAHGHSENVIRSLRTYKRIGGADVVAGNIVTAEAAEDLIAAGVDGLRVGIGAGSICLTREICGVGVPQLNAIAWVADAASKYGVPVIADGGIRRVADVVKAIAAGADCVMLGRMLAGTEEAPGEVVEKDGMKLKRYRGMGSAEVISRLDRYSKLVPEGISGYVPYRGSVREIVKMIIGGLKGGMGYVGASNLRELKEKSEFVRVPPSESWERRVGNIIIERQPPITIML